MLKRSYALLNGNLSGVFHFVRRFALEQGWMRWNVEVANPSFRMEGGIFYGIGCDEGVEDSLFRVFFSESETKSKAGSSNQWSKSYTY